MCVYICVCCVCVCVSCMTRVIRWLCTYSRGREKKFLPNRIRQKSSSETIIRKRRVHGRDETPTFVPSPLSLYYTLRGSLCFEAFADEHTFVRSDPLSLGIPWWDPAKFLFYFLSGTFNFSVTFFFFLSCWPNLYYYPVWWDDRRLCRVDRLNFAAGRKISGNIGRDRENGSESGKFGRDRTRYRDLARARPNFSESLRT